MRKYFSGNYVFSSSKSSEDQKEKKKKKKRPAPQSGTKFSRDLQDLFVLLGPFLSIQPASNLDGGTLNLDGGTLNLDGGTLNLDGGTLNLHGGTLRKRHSLETRTDQGFLKDEVPQFWPCLFSFRRSCMHLQSYLMRAIGHIPWKKAEPNHQRIADD